MPTLPEYPQLATVSPVAIGDHVLIESAALESLVREMYRLGTLAGYEEGCRDTVYALAADAAARLGRRAAR